MSWRHRELRKFWRAQSVVMKMASIGWKAPVKTGAFDRLWKRILKGDRALAKRMTWAFATAARWNKR